VPTDQRLTKPLCLKTPLVATLSPWRVKCSFIQQQGKTDTSQFKALPCLTFDLYVIRSAGVVKSKIKQKAELLIKHLNLSLYSDDNHSPSVI
jgi:hypothetical protein